jgi:hypothetical protein
MALLNGGNFPSLEDILFSRQGFKTSDLRDIIYGHLAIAGLHRPESKTFGAISVDYTKSVSEVFTDAAAYIYTSSGCLNLLRRVELKDSSRRRQDLPSWVPDWSLDSSNVLQPLQDWLEPTQWSGRMRLRSRLFYLESPPVLAIGALKVVAVEATSRDVIPSYDTIFKLESEIYESAISHLKESSRPYYTIALASTFDGIDERNKFVKETYEYVQQAMYSFWQERLGKTLLDACMNRRANPDEPMSRLDQYEGVITKRSKPFLEMFLEHSLRDQMARGFEFCGRRLALIGKCDGGERQDERLIAVPEATRSGDVIYDAMGEDFWIKSIVLRPSRDEISVAEDIDIVKKLRDKGCKFLGNDILHGRFVGICPISGKWSGKVKGLIVLH